MDSHPTKRSERALDAANLMLADVRDGLGPYLGIYLYIAYHWDQGLIGYAIAAAGIAGVIAQTPAGAIMDKVRHKRLLVAAAALAIGIGCVLMPLSSKFGAVLACQAVVGAAAAFVAPALAAISLGIVGRQQLSRRIGRNEAFNHGGNLLAAVLAGLIGTYLSAIGIFYLVGFFALCSLVSILMIRESDIDPALANGADGCEPAECPPSAVRVLLSNKPLLIFAAVGTLFHLANGAMLPLAGQMLAVRDAKTAAMSMSACIIAAQLVMVPVGLLAGRLAASWGRRPLLILMTAALPVRGLLYTVSAAPAFVVGVQLLDGIGAGIYGVLLPLVIADLTRGSGRFNSAQGAVSTAHQLGAAVSPALGGLIAAKFGFSTAFVTLAALAAGGLTVTLLLMPETRSEEDDAGPAADDALPAGAVGA